MENWLSRTELLIGEEGVRKLAGCRVAIFGLGGVGGYVAEALARCGIGAFDLTDNDSICLTNLNRQILATRKTLGRYKVDVAKERILEINPEAEVETHRVFYLPETAGQFDFSRYDYVVDAIDTVSGKLQLAEQAERAGVPLICSLGAGNKLDPTAFQVADIYSTSVCPLARVMRRELKKRGIRSLKTVYSKEPPRTPAALPQEGEGTRRQTPGSMSFVPSVAGLILAGEVIRDLLGQKN